MLGFRARENSAHFAPFSAAQFPTSCGRGGCERSDGSRFHVIINVIGKWARARTGPRPGDGARAGRTHKRLVVSWTSEKLGGSAGCRGAASSDDRIIIIGKPPRTGTTPRAMGAHAGQPCYTRLVGGWTPEELGGSSGCRSDPRKTTDPWVAEWSAYRDRPTRDSRPVRGDHST